MASSRRQEVEVTCGHAFRVTVEVPAGLHVSNFTIELRRALAARSDIVLPKTTYDRTVQTASGEWIFLDSISSQRVPAGLLRVRLQRTAYAEGAVF
jgi:hypothetical protein